MKDVSSALCGTKGQGCVAGKHSAQTSWLYKGCVLCVFNSRGSTRTMKNLRREAWFSLVLSWEASYSCKIKVKGMFKIFLWNTGISFLYETIKSSWPPCCVKPGHGWRKGLVLLGSGWGPLRPFQCPKTLYGRWWRNCCRERRREVQFPKRPLNNDISWKPGHWEQKNLGGFDGNF